MWPSSGGHFGIVFLYEDGTSENVNLSSANYLKGRICLGGWRSSEFVIIYSSDEPIDQPVYDWLRYMEWKSQREATDKGGYQKDPESPE